MKFNKVENGLNPPVSMQKKVLNESFNSPNSIQLNIEQKGLNPQKTTQPAPPPQTQNHKQK